MLTTRRAQRRRAEMQPLPSRPTTIFEEMLAAARGVAALVAGDRRAPGCFDFTPRGLAGSFIAFLVASVVSAYLPTFSGDAGYTSLPPPRLLTVAALLFAVQLGFSALVLRQLKRLDGFLPYLVADNWATFFITAISSVLALFGLGSDVVVIIIGILVLIVEINIARLIVTLSPWQIAMFLVAQLVGVSIGLIVIAIVFPLPADLVAPS
jgi:hypothetical protein